ncbi:hypothetical protein O181_001301 [Austropuccinia psidii MF-1]|uniref:Integrase catalytic domain-containing protein n=1 Tax=Austropuccinia psidii MF-1 TaxID=1389203 RepID=A0A9Q3BAQ8_9BASI|nr:hypothetical protein [Austropuccinia psidii MF-1]
MYIDYDLPRCHLTQSIKESILWHNRLGHPGTKDMKTLGLPEKYEPCITCETNKSHHFAVADLPLDFIQLDLVGPITPPSVSGFKYFLTIVDQASSFKIVKKIKQVVSDCGGEFLNENFKELANDNGYLHIYSPPETPQHNGFAERANQKFLENARCLLNASNLPHKYWVEAVNTATYLSNLAPSTAIKNQSPCHIWGCTISKIHRLRVFGCQEVIHCLEREKEWKLQPTGKEGIFLGYKNKNSAYSILQ